MVNVACVKFQKAEERRTIRDGEGNEETTITRAIGDQVHSVTTHQEGDTGREKKVENYTNMDERTCQTIQLVVLIVNIHYQILSCNILGATTAVCICLTLTHTHLIN